MKLAASDTAAGDLSVKPSEKMIEISVAAPGSKLGKEASAKKKDEAL